MVLKLVFSHKILNDLAASYLHNSTEPFDQTRSSSQSKCKPASGRSKTFESSFYPYCIKEWINLSEEICNIESVNQSKKTVFLVLLGQKKT